MKPENINKTVRKEINKIREYQRLNEERSQLIKTLTEDHNVDENYITRMLGMELTPKNAEKKIYKRAKEAEMLNTDESWTPGSELWNKRINASIELNDLNLTWEPAKQTFSTFSGDRIAIEEL